MNEVTTIEPADMISTSPVYSILLQVARDQNFDVAKFETLVRLQREFEIADKLEIARLAYIAAMEAAQAEMVPIVRDARNDQIGNKFSRLETIDAAIRPIYTRHGFTVEFNTEPTERGEIKVVCEVSHRGGFMKTREAESGADTLGPQGKPNKTPLHGFASTVSYLKRQLLGLAFNLAFKNEDNDGNRRTAAETGELVGPEQARELYALLAECSISPLPEAERAFLDKMDLKQSRSLKDVSPGHFVRLKNALLTKRAIVAQRTTRNQT